MTSITLRRYVDRAGPAIEAGSFAEHVDELLTGSRGSVRCACGAPRVWHDEGPADHAYTTDPDRLYLEVARADAACVDVYALAGEVST